MSKVEKLIEKLKKGNNMSFDEICTLLFYLGYELDPKGKTSGSRVKFYKQGAQSILFHKPHKKEMDKNALKDIAEILKGVI